MLEISDISCCECQTVHQGDGRNLSIDRVDRSSALLTGCNQLAILFRRLRIERQNSVSKSIIPYAIDGRLQEGSACAFRQALDPIAQLGKHRRTQEERCRGRGVHPFCYSLAGPGTKGFRDHIRIEQDHSNSGGERTGSCRSKTRSSPRYLEGTKLNNHVPNLRLLAFLAAKPRRSNSLASRERLSLLSRALSSISLLSSGSMFLINISDMGHL